MKEEKFNSRKCSQRQVCREFWNYRGQHNWEIKKKKRKEKKRKKSTEYAPNITASGEVAQNFISTTIILGLDREVWSAKLVLKVRTIIWCLGGEFNPSLPHGRREF